MTEALRAQRDATIALIDRLIRRGRELLTIPAGPEIRIWQRDCAEAVNELSGGSKAHWLSRGYSSALLVRADDGSAAVEADVVDIVRNVLDVLERGRRALVDLDASASAAPESQAPHRFDFVHDPDLRPVLEQAYLDSAQTLEAGDFAASMMTTCGILEAIITDALVARLKPDTTDVGNLSFDRRIAAAEDAGLIRGGCARLPPTARAYRDAPSGSVSAQDATRARQVLHVILRDLDPGR